MQAIVTKFIAPTNTRGSRIKATAQAGSITIAWDDATGIDENHRRAALALCERYEWPKRLVCGGLPDGAIVWPMTKGARGL
jgi:hypothetical protein